MLDFWYLNSVSETTDPVYAASFGAASIGGRLNGAIVFNSVPNFNVKFATLKFFKPPRPDDDGLPACVRKALAVSVAQVQLGPTPDGRNAGLVVKVTGDVRLNEGNGGPDGQPLTIVEIRNLKTVACEATFFFPDWP